jgi:hypothetical protein
MTNKPPYILFLSTSPTLIYSISNQNLYPLGLNKESQLKAL